MPEASLKEQLTQAMKDAMKAKEKERLSVIRMALAAFKQVEVDERIEVDDARSLVIIDKMVKQRKDSAEQFTQGGREDLAEKELAEIEVLKDFLPEAMDSAAIETLVKAAIEESGAEGMKDMGKVMAIVKPQAQGRADMGEVSKKVKALLG